MLDLLQGRRRVGAVTTLTLIGAANAVAIFTISTGPGMLGTEYLKIKRLKIRNNGVGNTWVHIGTGVAAGVDGIPPLYSIANTTDDYDEFDLPQVEFTGTIVAWPDVVNAGNFAVQVEVEEV